MNTIRAIDLFCGIGGNSCGARAAGIDIAAGFDKWALAGQVFQDNFPEARFYNVDLAILSRRQIYHFHETIGHVDLILASPECTSHSVARGARPKDKTSLRLSWNVWRFAEVFQPRWVVVENVPAFRLWEHYRHFLEIMQRSGYRVLEQMLVASAFGVPQRRRRLYLLFDRDREPRAVVPCRYEPLPASYAINLNGSYRYTPLVTANRAARTLVRAQNAIDVLGRDTPFLLVYYGSDKAGGWQSLDTPLRTITTLDRFALVRPDGRGGHEMRMLQPPELKKAMGFPPEFVINHGNRREQIKMLGNAVCPPVMQAIVQTLIADT
jgi:DNA (cytosine-5)-methyltransferase 1